MKFLTCTAVSLIFLSPQLAAGQEAETSEPIDAGEITLSDWSYDGIYTDGGMSIDTLFGVEVYGAGGEEIGDVEDVVIDTDGNVVALIAEVGGFWDIGDTHVAVPWDQVDIRSTERVEIPLTEETVDDFDIFEYSGLENLGDEVVAGLDDQPIAGRFWRASELIGDYVRVRDDNDERYVNYGYVADILVQNDQIAATVIRTNAAYGLGRYAYPVGPGYPANWTPGMPAYDLPYMEGDVRGRPEFDYERMGGEGG